MASYVDVLGGLDDTTGYKAPCRLATTVDLGTGLVGLLVIDSVQTVAGDRVLVWQQANQATNGIYVVNTGAWTRAIDFSSSSSILDGTQVYVASGASLGDNVFVCQTSNPAIGSTNVTFLKQSSTPVVNPSRVPFRKIIAGTSDTATTSDGMIVWVAGGGGGKTERLPAASSIGSGQSISIKDGFGDAGLNNITILPNGTDTIDNGASAIISVGKGELAFTSDGVSNWVVS